MAASMKEYLATATPKGFHAKPYYSEDGDYVSVHFENKDHYADRIDEHLTVYLSTDGEESCVGFKLKGVRHLTETLDDYRISHDNGNWSLNILLLAVKVKNPEKDSVPVYQQLAQKASESVVKIPRRVRELQPA